jgi:hypothetical protein
MCAPIILEFNDKIKIRTMAKKIMVFCCKFAKRRCPMIIYPTYMKKVIHIDNVIWTNCRSYVLIWRFNFEACYVCKVLLKGPHNISIDVNTTKSQFFWQRILIKKTPIWFFSLVKFDQNAILDNPFWLWPFWLSLFS